MFFRNKDKNRGEDLNRKVEKYKKWWQDRTQERSLKRSDSSRENRGSDKPFDSSFVYYDEA